MNSRGKMPEGEAKQEEAGERHVVRKEYPVSLSISQT
jgi:hypothetical protein